MKEGADKEFFDLINNSGLGTVQRLPKNCQATHVFHTTEARLLLPLKLCVESNSKRWNFKTDYCGIIVLWIVSEKSVFICHTNDLDINNIRSSTLVSQRSVSTFENFATKLVTASKDHNDKIENILAFTKYKVVGRDETRLRASTIGLESVAHEEILSLLGSNQWIETPEKCKADAAFHLGDPNFSIPVQTKSCTLQAKRDRFNIFHNTSGYDGMILFCRPVIRLYIGTLVIPGKLAPDSIGLSLTAGTKYVGYIVPDPQLSQFMKSLYHAVQNNNTTFKWPSGAMVDISDLRLTSYSTLCMPTSPAEIIERQNFEWRMKALPDFEYVSPAVQGTTVDVLMNNVRVQDKTACERASKGYGMSVKLEKSDGRRDGTKKTVPYSAGDFDALFVFPPNKAAYFYLIPTAALLEQSIISHGDVKGKKSFLCYSPDYKFRGGATTPNLWTQKHCFCTTDPQVQAKVARVLEECKKFRSSLQ